MKEKKQKRLILIFLIYFLLIGTGFAILFSVYQKEKKKKIDITLDKKNNYSPDISIDVQISNNWQSHPDHGNPYIAAQYDFTVENNLAHALKDWQLEITLPEEAVIDSSWNGTFTQSGSTIVFEPGIGLDVAKIKSGSSEDFGVILSSQKVMKITDFRLTGYQDIRLTQYAAFYVLITLLSQGVVVVLVYSILALRTRQLRLRQQQDEQVILETMHTIANFIDAKDRYTNGHSFRVCEYSVKLARKMNLSEDDVRKIGYAGLMHDCGKMGIADSILLKPAPLTDEEFEILKQHTVYGGNILQNMTTIKGIREAALYHHERYDGKGYPEGLKGDEIPFYARLIGVADSYDAMSSDRCYRKGLPKKIILEELKKNTGTQFDPDIVIHMIDMLENDEI